MFLASDIHLFNQYRKFFQTISQSLANIYNYNLYVSILLTVKSTRNLFMKIYL